MIFKHPLRKEDGSEYNTEDFFRRLSEENTGHYLLGSYHFWHGGIHFSHGNKEVEAKSDKKEGDAKDNSVEDSSTEESSSSPKKIKIVPHYEPVYAIGEGELIAYRLNKKYKQSTYENRDGETWELDYSTSFCLIKHELEVEKEEPPKATPPTTTTTGTEGTSTTTADAESAEWVLSGNQPHRHLVKNGETLSTIVNKWIETYKTTSATALADIKDLNPQLSEDLSNRAGETILLPDYKILEEEPFASSFPLTTPKEKVVVKLTFYSLYMHLAAYEDYKEKPQTITVTSGNINARNATDVNSVIGTFSKGATLEHQGEEQTVGSNHFVLGKITAGKVVLDNIMTAKVGDNVWVSSNHVGFSSNSIDKPPYWGKEGVKPKSAIDEHLETAQGSRDIGLVNPYPTENSPTTANSAPELHNPIPEKPKEPKEPKKLYLQYDSVQTCSIPVTADTLIGHLGRYDILAPYEQNKREVTSKNQLHYEIFTNASESELNKFLDNKAGLFQDRKFIKLAKGSKIMTSLPESIAPTPEYTLQYDHAIALDAALVVKGGGRSFYRVVLPESTRNIIGYYPKTDEIGAFDILTGGNNGIVISPPKDKNIVCQHDWCKMGFEIVKESNADSDGLMDLEKMPKFFKDLHKEIDQFGAKGRAGYGDGVITAVELKLALQNHRLRDRWSKLIAYHPSEWRKNNASIAEAMKELLIGAKRTLNTWQNKGKLKKNEELGNKVLEHEKERMKELSFWEDVSELGAPSVYHFHPIAFVGNLQINGVPLREAQELALRVSGGYEGKGDLDYHALADDFDGQGTSFGLIQWNFGQNTLGPVLLKMYNRDSTSFENSFPDDTNYENLRIAIINHNQNAQLAWARDLLENNRSGWSKTFSNLGSVQVFQDIQLNEALEYHKNVMRSITIMRGIDSNLMNQIHVVTYVALYDLCVQQGSISRGDTVNNIIRRYNSEQPKDQIEFLTIVVQERAKTASTRWRADAMSRRMGIIQQSSYTSVESGHSATRNNPNFHLLKKYRNKHVHEL